MTKHSMASNYFKSNNDIMYNAPADIASGGGEANFGKQPVGDGKGPAHKKQYSHTHEGVGDSISNTLKDFVGYKESGRNRYALGGLVKYKSDDWSSGYSDVQRKVKNVAPGISGKKD